MLTYLQHPQQTHTDQFAKSKAVHIINKNGFELDRDIIDKLLVQIQETLVMEGNIDTLI